MNHLRSGMERIYDGYELEEEKAAWFLLWEREIAGIARRIGVADALGVPSERPSPLDGLNPIIRRASQCGASGGGRATTLLPLAANDSGGRRSSEEV